MRRALIAMLAMGGSLALAPTAQALPIDGIHNIQHVVMIMQENRTFDSYFGTYPGANGIPPGVSVSASTRGSRPGRRCPASTAPACSA